MPVFECSRCNHLTYSATLRIELRCDRCGADRLRILDDPISFDEARERARDVERGDHVCAAFDAPEQIAGLAAGVLREGVARGAIVHGCLGARVAGPVRERLGEDAAGVEWRSPDELYGGDFDPQAVSRHYEGLAPAVVYVVAALDRPVTEVASVETWRRYERIVHETTVALGMVVLCLYDRSVYPAEYLELCEQTHPLSSADGDVRRNGAFVYEPA